MFVFPIYLLHTDNLALRVAAMFSYTSFPIVGMFSYIYPFPTCTFFPHICNPIYLLDTDDLALRVAEFGDEVRDVEYHGVRCNR